MDERILIPDHTDLRNAATRGRSFLLELRDCAETQWQLPDAVTSPAVERAWSAIFDSWTNDLGEFRRRQRPALRQHHVDVYHGAYQHMGFCVVTAMADQLAAVRAATAAIAASQASPCPADMDDLAELIHNVRDEEPDTEASYTAFRGLARILDITHATNAAAPHDERTVCPRDDVALILEQVQNTGGHELHIAGREHEAYHRLLQEWHYAIYGDDAESAYAQRRRWTY